MLFGAVRWRAGVALGALAAATASSGCDRFPRSTAVANASLAAGLPGGPALAPPEPEPPLARVYTTTSTSRTGVPSDGAAALERITRKLLEGRSPNLAPDGRLDALASFLVEWISLSHPVDPASVASAASRLGLVDGARFVASLRAPALDEARMADELRRVTDTFPSNIPLTHLGVAARRDGDGWLGVVVVTSRRVVLEPFPQSVPAGGQIALRGAVVEPFVKARLSVTAPDGTVSETDLPRAFDTTVPLATRGAYKVELFGEGATGPVVVANVPVYVGTTEPIATRTRRTLPLGAATTAAAVEARLFGLLNDARAQAGLPPLVRDEELDHLALTHSEDQRDHGFFGHVSPTTGEPSDRARKLGVNVSLLGENVVLAESPETGHDQLMASPGHRANVLRREFTHVGIGAALKTGPGSLSEMYMTQVFGRRPPPLRYDTAPKDVLAIYNAEREKRKLSPLRMDPDLQAAATAAAGTVAGTSDQRRALTAASHRLGSPKARSYVACLTAFVTPDLEQVKASEAALAPQASLVGIGAAPAAPGEGGVFVVILQTERGPKVPCR